MKITLLKWKFKLMKLALVALLCPALICHGTLMSGALMLRCSLVGALMLALFCPALIWPFMWPIWPNQSWVWILSFKKMKMSRDFMKGTFLNCYIITNYNFYIYNILCRKHKSFSKSEKYSI